MKLKIENQVLRIVITALATPLIPIVLFLLAMGVMVLFPFLLVHDGLFGTDYSKKFG